MPSFGALGSVTWFGVMRLLGGGLGILASQGLVTYLEKRGAAGRTGVVFLTSAGYILALIVFALGRQFGLMMAAFLLTGLMRSLKEPVLAAWMNEHTEERMRATVFSANGQMDALGQVLGGPLVGLAAQRVSVAFGLICTALLLFPALLLIPAAGRAPEKGAK